MSHMNDHINRFSIIIASVPYRNNCVCEIYYDNVQWVEISKEDHEVIMQFYPHPTQPYWEFPAEVALEVLKNAHTKFLNGS